MSQQPSEPEAPTCECGISAVKRTVKKNGPTFNHEFWACQNGKVDDGGCGFFEWLPGYGPEKRVGLKRPLIRRLPEPKASSQRLPEPVEEPPTPRRKTFEVDSVPFAEAMANGASTMLTVLNEFQKLKHDLEALVNELRRITVPTPTSPPLNQTTSH